MNKQKNNDTITYTELMNDISSLKHTIEFHQKIIDKGIGPHLLILNQRLDSGNINKDQFFEKLDNAKKSIRETEELIENLKKQKTDLTGILSRGEYTLGWNDGNTPEDEEDAINDEMDMDDVDDAYYELTAPPPQIVSPMTPEENEKQNQKALLFAVGFGFFIAYLIFGYTP